MKIYEFKRGKIYENKNYHHLRLTVDDQGIISAKQGHINIYIDMSLDAIHNEEWEEVGTLPKEVHEKLCKIKIYCESIKDSSWTTYPEVINMMDGILNIIGKGE